MDADFFCFAHFLVVDFSSHGCWSWMGGFAEHWELYSSLNIAVVLSLRDYSAIYLYWLNPFSAACCFIPFSIFAVSENTSPAMIVSHLRHICCTQTSQVREYPGEPHSSVSVSCCLSFCISWIWREAVVGSQVFDRMLWLEAVLWV